MRIIFSLLGLLVIILVVVGFYRGWFRVSGGNNENKSHVTMSVNKSRMRADKNSLVRDVKNITPATTAPARDGASDNSPATVPGDTSTYK